MHDVREAREVRARHRQITGYVHEFVPYLCRTVATRTTLRYAFREPQTRKGLKLKQAMVRVKDEFHPRYTHTSGKKGLFVQWARRPGIRCRG